MFCFGYCWHGWISFRRSLSTLSRCWEIRLPKCHPWPGNPVTNFFSKLNFWREKHSTMASCQLKKTLSKWWCTFVILLSFHSEIKWHFQVKTKVQKSNCRWVCNEPENLLDKCYIKCVRYIWCIFSGAWWPLGWVKFHTCMYIIELNKSNICTYIHTYLQQSCLIV